MNFKVHCNFATWESAVYGFASAKNLPKIRKEMFKFRLAKPTHPAPKRFMALTACNIVKNYEINLILFS